jgi:hypothetical protein
MSEPVTERLYNLLPAIHRIRDVDHGEPLRALLGVLEGELLNLRSDIEALYDDWFIETCAEWVVPYIGDLVGVRGLLPPGGRAFSQRGRVANALAQRRGKGTAAALEHLARDVTGWPVRVVEFFELLATVQHLNHVRPNRPATVDLRDVDQLELLGGPFERAAHTAEVRHVASTRGKYDIPHLGIFLWRLQSYAVSGSTARAVPATQPEQGGRFRFHPLGLDAPLFNLPRSTQPGTEAGVPAPLRRRPLHDDVSAQRIYFGTHPVFAVRLQAGANGPLESVSPDDLAVCDLSDADVPEGWRRPPAAVRVAVDPVLGRLALPSGVVPARVEVDYAYGFSADLGGGPYNRRESIAAWLADSAGPPLQLRVGAGAATLADAITAWNSQPPGTNGVITIIDSHTHPAGLEVLLPASSRLLLAAGARQRPHVLGNLTVRGTAPTDALTPGSLSLNGLLVEGNLLVSNGNLAELRISHTTLAPVTGGGVLVAVGNDRLEVLVERSIVGPIRLAETVRRVRLLESIVDGIPGSGTAMVASSVGVDGCTVIGSTLAQRLDASNSVFTGDVAVERRQTGCVRFSFVSRGSLVPRRFHCQPTDDADNRRITPRFTSLSYGQPGYGQLAPTCPAEIRTGADDEGEMGAFHFLQQTQRIGSMQASLDEHLRFGLEAGVFLVT